MARVFSWIIEADKIGYAYITNGKSGTAEEPLLTIEKLGDETDEFKTIFRRANSMPKADYDRLFYRMKDMISDEFNVTMEGESEDYFGEGQNYILLSGRNGDGHRIVDLSGGAEQRKAALDEFAAYWRGLGNTDLNGAMFIARGLTETPEIPENDVVMSYTPAGIMPEGYSGFMACGISNISDAVKAYNVHIALDGSVTAKAVRDKETLDELSRLENSEIPESKLSSGLQSKVNNNVKYVEQNLDNAEIGAASKNLKIRDDNGNFFASPLTFSEYVSANSRGIPVNNVFGIRVYQNTFGDNVSNNTFGHNIHDNSFGNHVLFNNFGNIIWNNKFGSYVNYNTFGNGLTDNIIGSYVRYNVFGNGLTGNNFGNFLYNSKIDNDVSFIELKSNASDYSRVQDIHILSGVRGESATNRLAISIPDEYLNSSRELIITTKATNGGASTPDDIVMYYADEVATKQEVSGKVDKTALFPILQEVDLTGTYTETKTKIDQFETDWKALTGASDLNGARFIGKVSIDSNITYGIFTRNNYGRYVGTCQVGNSLGDDEFIPYTIWLEYGSDRVYVHADKSGSITEITMNGESKGTLGVVDLGTVLTEHQTLKTINGETITGSGNIIINGGASDIFPLGTEMNPLVIDVYGVTNGSEQLNAMQNQIAEVAKTNIGSNGLYVKVTNDSGPYYTGRLTVNSYAQYGILSKIGSINQNYCGDDFDKMFMIFDSSVEGKTLNISYFSPQDKTDNSLTTTDKTIVGAINEIKNSVNKDFNLSYDRANIYVEVLDQYTIPADGDVSDTNFQTGNTISGMPVFVMEIKTTDQTIKRYLDPFSVWKPFPTTGEYTWLPVIAYANRSGLTFYNKITGLYLVKKNGEFLKGSNGTVAFYTFNKNGHAPQSTDVPTTTYANNEPIYIIGGQDSTNGCGWNMSETFTVTNLAEDILANYPEKIDATDKDYITAGYSVDTGGNVVDGSADGIKLDSSINKFTIFEITFKRAAFGNGGEIKSYATSNINETEHYFGVQGAMRNGEGVKYLIAVDGLNEAMIGTAAWTAETSTNDSLLTIMDETTGISTNSSANFVEYYDAASATPSITDSKEMSYLYLETDSGINVEQKFYPIGHTFVEVSKTSSNIAYYLGYIGQK